MNALAAAAAGIAMGKDGNAIGKGINKITGVPHRLELLKVKHGVSWYNDSIATTPQSVVVALEAFGEPKILIAGGYDKQLPFDELGCRIAAQGSSCRLPWTKLT